MKTLVKSIVLGSILFMTQITAASNTQEVENFVSRFYTEVLGRPAEVAGLNYWTNKLISGDSTGSDVATGFIFSNEFISKNTTDTVFLNILYKAFFNRAADVYGFNGWMNELGQGTSRENVLNGFLYSTEFANLAEAYGIKAVPDGSNASGGVVVFVQRFYFIVLGRTADAGGLSSWVNRLNTQVATGEDIATGFVFSPEFDEASKDDVTFIKVLYKAFFNREADEGGLNLWLSQLEQGVSRADVLKGFLGSQEFVNLANSYGIVANEDAKENLRDIVLRNIVGTWSTGCISEEGNESSSETLTYNADGSGYWNESQYNELGCNPQGLVNVEEGPFNYIVGAVVKAADGTDAVELNLDAPGDDDWYTMIRFNNIGDLLAAEGNSPVGESITNRANDFLGVTPFIKQ